MWKKKQNSEWQDNVFTIKSGNVHSTVRATNVVYVQNSSKAGAAPPDVQTARLEISICLLYLTLEHSVNRFQLIYQAKDKLAVEKSRILINV